MAERICQLADNRHCEERGDEAISLRGDVLNCFAKLVIGPATSGQTRWLAMTSYPSAAMTSLDFVTAATFCIA
jgi:hypothetical protein